MEKTLNLAENKLNSGELIIDKTTNNFQLINYLRATDIREKIFTKVP